MLAVVGLHNRAVADQEVEWIWGDREAQRFEVESAFDLPSRPARARLKCAVDFCTAAIRLNGKPACRFDSEERLQEIDVLHFLEPGTNQIRIAAEKTQGPAAVAYELRITTSDGGQHIVCSSDGMAAIRSASQLHAYGSASQESWWNIKRSPHVSAFDEYNQWEEAKSASEAEELAGFQIADGFEIELVFSAGPEHGSWVSMEVDEQGRILLGREDAGIVRLTLPDGSGEPVLETLDNQLKGVQGLLLTPQGLFASANRSEGLFRLPTIDGQGLFAPGVLMRATAGGDGDHGRHAVVQDHAGRVYVVHGDAIEIPSDATSLVPLTNEFEEQKPAAGHVIQTDAKGEKWNVYCSGLRNPYGLTFNDAGEMFTFDADAERHTGLPWYRPTRIIHLMPGVDYGWRDQGRPWPGYLPDMMPPSIKIGRGSPTGLQFGGASSFPAVYRRALFALDWSYGRILAVHLVPTGATYAGHAEVLVRGRPFSVCDLDFDNDGSMLVVTGGRDTPSRIYRIRYAGDLNESLPKSIQIEDREAYSQRLRDQRRQLEDLFAERDPASVETAWRHLPHPDRAVRSAARILLEHQDPSDWMERLWNEQTDRFALPALLALARIGEPHYAPRIDRKLQSLTWRTTLELQTAARIAALVDEQLPDEQQRSRRICEMFDPSYPTGRRVVDRELCRLLTAHDSDVVVERTIDLLGETSDQIDRFHYLACISHAKSGWTPDRHDAFFRLLSGARLYITDEGLEELLDGLFDKALEQVDQSQQTRYRELFAVQEPAQESPLEPLPFQRRWTVDEIVLALADVQQTANIDNGRRLFERVGCSRCHRFAAVGRAFGPDLTTVPARYGRRRLLEEIVEPSKTISSQYQNYVIALSSGKTLQGQVVYNGFRKSIWRIATDPMALHKTIEVKKDDIDSYEPSGVSPMPTRLLDGLAIEQIADLLAYLESGVQ